MSLTACRLFTVEVSAFYLSREKELTLIVFWDSLSERIAFEMSVSAFKRQIAWHKVKNSYDKKRGTCKSKTFTAWRDYLMPEPSSFPEAQPRPMESPPGAAEDQGILPNLESLPYDTRRRLEWVQRLEPELWP
jgi:hypothetical protein